MTPPALDAGLVHAKLRAMREREDAQVDLAFVARGVDLARTGYRAYVREVARALPA